MEMVLLDLMGSAAVASGVLVGIITTRLSRVIAHGSDSRLEHPGSNQSTSD